eukprot:GFUD01133393.1.p1 GENE.GFUD01133393.1~~GFUD01133393.1.p1  ORF type:complete len:305 (-),score=74.07 GFUD01133393.1:34-831(-)
MSDLRRTARGQLWSDCSVKQIKHFLKTTTASCLHNPPRHQDYSLPGPSSLPGTLLSVDAQCLADRGTRACYHDQRVCAQLFCYNRDYNGCYAYRPAVEGSSCGNGKMCISGKCVTKTSTYVRKQTSDNPGIKRKPKIYNTSKATPTRKNSRPSKKAKKASTPKGKWNRRKPKRSSKTKQNKSKQHKISQRKPKSHLESNQSKKVSTTNKATEKQVDENKTCEDTFSLQGSLNCEQLFKRYAFHYCERNKVIKKKCCKSYRAFCQT